MERVEVGWWDGGRKIWSIVGHVVGLGLQCHVGVCLGGGYLKSEMEVYIITVVTPWVGVGLGEVYI